MTYFVGERESSKNVLEIGCKNWEEFRGRIIADHFDDGLFKKGRYLFRGQGSDSWTLSTTFDRWFSGKRFEKAEISKRLLEEFTNECELEDVSESLRQDKVAMLGLAQHHGLPTRLLDWSESPYVAAFFAFSGHVRAGYFVPEDSTLDLVKYVAIWVLDSEDVCWGSESGCSIENVPAFWNSRIKNQLGKFTYLRAPYDSLEEHVENFEKGEVCLRKYLVPATEFGRALADMDAMGLTHARIFPGLEGNARAAELRVSLSRT